MSEENRLKVYKLAWKIRQLIHRRRSRGELNDLLNMTVTELLEEIDTFPKLKGNFSWHDLFELFNGPLHIPTMNDLSRVKKKNDIIPYVDKYIFTQTKVFNFYFKFGYKADFRSGFQLGDGIFCSLSKMPKKSRQFIRQHIPYEQEKLHYPTMKRKDWIRIRNRDTYMKVSVDAIGKEKAKEKAFSKLRRNFNILNFIMGGNFTKHDIMTTQFYYYLEPTDNQTGELSEGNKLELHIWKPKHLDKYIKKINLIFNKTNPSDLEQRILRAIDVYGLIELDTPLHVRFLLCIIGLESLLLDKDDRDYLGLKMAEKITFLLADVKWWHKEIYKIPHHRRNAINDEFVKKHLFDARIKMHEKVKHFYDLRSGFAHRGIQGKKDVITENDYYWADHFLRWAIEKLVYMTSKYTHIAKKNAEDKKYLDKIFQKLRYS